MHDKILKYKYWSWFGARLITKQKKASHHFALLYTCIHCTSLDYFHRIGRLMIDCGDNNEDSDDDHGHEDSDSDYDHDSDEVTMVVVDGNGNGNNGYNDNN